MSDKNTPNIDDVSGKRVLGSGEIWPENKWQPPAEKGGGLFQRGPRKGNGKPTAQAVAPDASPARTDYENFDWATFVEEGRKELASKSRSNWRLGDMAVSFTRNQGRPAADDNEPRLADLADAWGISPQRASEWINCSQFWPANVRTVVIYEQFYWEHYSEARKRAQAVAPDAEQHVQLGHAMTLLNEGVRLHLYNTEEFSDWAKCMTFYATPDWALYPELSWQFYSVARKASAGIRDNALELLDAAFSKGLSLDAFKAYCVRPKPAPGGSTPGHKFVIPESTVWETEYYDAIRELLPDDVQAGDSFTITVTRD